MGIERTNSLLDADLAIRSVGSGSCHPQLDVQCDGDRVVLTIAEKPPLDVWLMMLDLVGHLAPRATDGVQLLMP